MRFFEIEAKDISGLNDGDLRELVGRLCEAELVQGGLPTSSVTWGGAQEAADGGLDVSVKAKGQLTISNFVPRSATGYQVKKHSIGKTACKKEMQAGSAAKPVIAELAKIGGAYIIVSGKDDCSDRMLADRLDGMQEAVATLENKADLKLDFYGRDRIATWLRQHPGVSLWVRHKLGKPLSGWRPFGRWAATPSEMGDEFLTDDYPCVLLANSPADGPQPLLEGVKFARERLLRAGSVLRVTGLSGVGKTRFAQALFEESIGDNSLPQSGAIYADLGDDLSPSASELVEHLIANDNAAYLVLDNCPPDIHRQLQKKVASSGTNLRLLTIEYDISDDKPEETEVIHLEPSSEETVSKLVQRRFPDLGRPNADRIAEFSGGNARVALALASRVEADETLANFSDDDLFKRLFSQRKGVSDSLLESAEVLSLFYSFNVEPEESMDELQALSRISGIERRVLHRNHAELLRRQLAQKRGNWRAVLPHALANRLARNALENIAISDINSELLKFENIRLFKSCAHRIGYLHDCEAAKDLANSWIAPGAPLHDIAACDSERLVCLNYIAPVFPETVLAALEEATRKTGFATRSNPQFTTFVRLLCHLAYEDAYFERALAILLKFAETEKRGENNNSVVGQMKQLFSLYLSGTEASPVRRQTFAERLLVSSDPRNREIADDLFDSALEASHWSSFSTFNFGARRRTAGWQPDTNGEKLDWYVGFINVLKGALRSNETEQKKAARRLLSSHFRGLWTFAGCFDALETIVREHAKGGVWPELWIAIKNTIHFDADKHEPALLQRLTELERISAPADPYTEIEAYALSSTWDHAEVKGEKFSDALAEVHEKIITLGELACAEPEYLSRLGVRLWEKHIDALWYFGKGLARGSSDKKASFELLLGLVDKASADRVDPILLQGFVNEVHEADPNLARQMQERFLRERKLKEHFVYLLGAAPIEAWGAKKLIELATTGELEAWRFAQLSYGRLHETITDESLILLVEALMELEGGISSVFNILEMRFFIDQDSGYTPSEPLLAAGRSVIGKMLEMHHEQISSLRSHGVERVAIWCLPPTAPENEVAEIVRLLCDGIESHRLYSYELEDLISILVKNFPELVLDHVFAGDSEEALRVHMLFRGRMARSSDPALNKVPVERLVAWCHGNQDKIQNIAKGVGIYSTVEAAESPVDNPKRVVLSSHIKAILDVADDKPGLVETIAMRTWPSSWSGSLADILEARLHAFSELLSHPLPEIRLLAEAKRKLIAKSIVENRAREAEEYSSREQRFE
jgi:hypothetical protein